MKKTTIILALALFAGLALAGGQQGQTIDSLNVRNIFRLGIDVGEAIALGPDSIIWMTIYGTDTLIAVDASDPEDITVTYWDMDTLFIGTIAVVDDSFLLVYGNPYIRTININRTPPEIVASYTSPHLDNPHYYTSYVKDSFLITQEPDSDWYQKAFFNISDPMNIDTFITGFGPWESYGYHAPRYFAKKDSIIYGTWLGCGGAPCNWTLYIYVIDVSDYSNPFLDTVLAFSRTYGDYSAIVGDAACIVVDSFLIVAINNYECSYHCEVFDISNPTEPEFSDYFGGPHGSLDMDYQEPYLYAGEYIYDLSGYPDTDSLIGYYVDVGRSSLIPNGHYFYTINAFGFEIFEFFAWDTLLGISTEPINRDTYDEMFLLPNPANRFANIRLPSPLEGEIEIYNILGQRVARKDIIASEMEYNFDLSDYSPGLYLVSIKSGDIRISKKLVVLG